MSPAASDDAPERTPGFPAILGDRPRVLILGSLPSKQSLAAGQYYGNPRNAFWRIMGDLVDAGPEVDYTARTQRLTRCRIAVWDVLASSVRPGSMDSSIDAASAVPNDFPGLFSACPTIDRVFFNGRKAAELFRRLVAPLLENGSNTMSYKTLPSTSPAYAAMSYRDKLVQWKSVRAALDNK